jgi:hypothetical protein
MPRPAIAGAMASTPDIAALSFEDALKELEVVVRRLESGEAPLDESIDLYARARPAQGMPGPARCRPGADRGRWPIAKGGAAARARSTAPDPMGTATNGQALLGPRSPRSRPKSTPASTRCCR